MDDKTLTERIEAILTPTGRTPRDPEMQRIIVLPGHNAGKTAALIAALKGDQSVVVDITTDFASIEQRVLSKLALDGEVSLAQDGQICEISEIRERRYYPVPAAGNRRERREEAARRARQRKKRR